MKKYLIIIICAIALLGIVDTANAGAIFRPMFHGGLVGYWDFQEGSGNQAYDKSGNLNHGTLTNMAENDWIDGKLGQALDFDGVDDYIDTGAWNVAGDVTFSMWVNRNEETNQQRLFSKHQDNGGPALVASYYVDIGSDETIMLCIYDGTSSNADCHVSPVLSWTSGQWYYIVFTYIDSTKLVTAYRNGINLSNGVVTYNLGACASPVRIGSLGTQYFNGTIDEVRIYNRALSASEVGRLYRMGKLKIKADTSRTYDSTAIITDGLLLHWSLDENTGTNVYDSSGNNQTGTWNGSGSHWTIGKFGAAGGIFDGSTDYVTRNDPSNMLSNQAGTISAWVYPTGTGSVVMFSDKDDTWGGTPSEINFYVGGGVDTGLLAVQVTKDVSAVSPGFQTKNDTLEFNTWNHVVLTSNGSAYHIFINGEDRLLDFTSGSNDGTWLGDITSEDNVSIGAGRRSNGLRTPFTGKIDEVCIYNRALSADEVKSLYESGAARTKVNSSTVGKLSDGLVGHWTFDGPDMAGMTAYDRSGNGNNGTLTNGPERAIGKLGQALDFDGADDQLNIPDDSSLDIVSGITVVLWVKPDALGGFQQLIEKGASNDLNLYMNGQYFTNYNTIQSTITLSNNEWVHLVYVEDGTNESLYVNGLLDVSESTAWNGANNAEILSIGISGEGSEPFNGSIDEVRVYNRALSADEIQRLYNMGR